MEIDREADFEEVLRGSGRDRGAVRRPECARCSVEKRHPRSEGDVIANLDVPPDAHRAAPPKTFEVGGVGTLEKQSVVKSFQQPVIRKPSATLEEKPTATAGIVAGKGR